MIKSNITGGVSPLKRKRQASRGGKKAGKATATGKRRGGFAKSKGKRGGGGRNVGGYNVQTRFKADKWTPPASGGTTVIPAFKPYSYDKDGKLQVNPQQQPSSNLAQKLDLLAQLESTTTPGTPGTKGTPEEGYWEKYDKNIHQDLESYQAVWDKDKSVRTKYDSVEDFAKDADKWWNEQAAAQNTTVAELKKSYKRVKTETGWRWVKTKDATEGTEGTEGSTKVKATTTVGGTTTVGTSGN